MTVIVFVALVINAAFWFAYGIGFGSHHSVEFAGMLYGREMMMCSVALILGNIGVLFAVRADQQSSVDFRRDSRRIIERYDVLAALADGNPWVPVTERLPRFDRPTLVWGDKLDGDDFPHLARLCGCHEKWISEEHWLDTDHEDDLVEHLLNMVGNVTHWLDWSPPVGTEG
jgi:hypothetical protein